MIGDTDAETIVLLMRDLVDGDFDEGGCEMRSTKRSNARPIAALQSALEKAGVEFLADNGGFAVDERN